ncbi:MAG TPA: GAF domain-containing protein [Anaerolineae bacterium]|nr:GAF domain-containing protein [Anaerolineae bacterium]
MPDLAGSGLGTKGGDSAGLPDGYVRIPAAYEKVEQALARGEYVALVGPKCSGKTLLLRDVMASLRARDDCLCVYLDLDAWHVYRPMDLFRTMATHLLWQAVCADAASEEDHVPAAPAPSPDAVVDSLTFRHFLADLLHHVPGTIVLAVDHVESLPRYLIKASLRCLRVIYTERGVHGEYERVVAVAAGRLNLFQLTHSTVSPFNIATLVSMPAADETLGREIVTRKAGTLGVSFSNRAVERILKATRGDLGLVGPLCERAAAGTNRMTRSAVKRALKAMKAEGVAAVPCLAERVRMVEADPFVLKLVLDVLAGQEVKRRELLTDVDSAELTGMVRLEDHRYALRNEVCEAALRLTFTPRRVARLFSASGRWDEAVGYFEQGDPAVDPAERAEYLAAVVNRIYGNGGEPSAFEGVAEALARGFDVGNLVVHSHESGAGLLVPAAVRGQVPELAPISTSEAGERPQVRALVEEDYLLEGDEAGRSLLILPLSSGSGLPAAGVVTLYDHFPVEQYVERREEVLEIAGFLAQAGRAIASRRERRGLLRSVQQRVEALTALGDVTKAIMAVRDQGQLLGQVADSARAVLGADLVTLYPFESRTRQFTAPIGSGLRDEEAFQRVPLPQVDGLVAGRVLRTGQPLFIPDAHVYPAGRSAAFVQHEGLRSVACYPLRHAAGPVGVLFVGYRHPHRFSAGEWQITAAFADHAAIAIENARLYGHLEMAHATQASMYQVSSAMRTSLEREQVLEAVTGSLQKLFDLATCTVGLLDDAGERIEFVAHLGLDRPTARLVRDLPLDLWHLIHDELKIFDTRNLAAYPALLAQLERDDLQSFVVCPLQGREGFLGIVTMGSTGTLALEPADRDAIRALADQAAVAIENAQLHQRVQEAHRWVDTSYKVLTHQLRAEPAFVSNTLSTLLAGKLGELNDRQRDRLEKAQRRLEQHHELLNRLHIYGRLKAGRLELQKAPVSLAAIVDRVVAETREMAYQAGVMVETHVATLAPLLLDEALMALVVDNLLHNAVKFAPKGSCVDVTTWADGRGVHLAVDDTGPGIPVELREKVFEEYFQVRAEDAAMGTGLGLYIARRVAEMHGGRLAILDKDGPGARLELLLPA